MSIVLSHENAIFSTKVLSFGFGYINSLDNAIFDEVRFKPYSSYKYYNAS